METPESVHGQAREKAPVLREIHARETNQFWGQSKQISDFIAELWNG